MAKTSRRKTTAKSAHKRSKTPGRSPARRQAAHAKPSRRKKAAVRKGAPKEALKRVPKKVAKKTAKRPAKRVAKATAPKRRPAPPRPQSAEPARPARTLYEVPPQVDHPKLTRLQIRELRAMLEAERSRLIREIGRLANENLSENAPDQPNRFGNHLADVASDNQMLETLLVQSGMEADRLREITEALERMDRRRYGICERCGANIGWERLQAKPYARLCIVCRSHVEAMGS